MKLNNLIKYNSLKALSLFGYLFSLFLYICRLSVFQIINDNSFDGSVDIVFLMAANLIFVIYNRICIDNHIVFA